MSTFVSTPVLALPAVAVELDPIFAAIENHERLWDEFGEVIREEKDLWDILPPRTSSIATPPSTARSTSPPTSRPSFPTCSKLSSAPIADTGGGSERERGRMGRRIATAKIALSRRKHGFEPPRERQ